MSLYIKLSILLVVLSSGFFGWQFIDNLFIENKKLLLKSETLKMDLADKSFESEQRLNAVNIYSKIADKTAVELDAIKKQRSQDEIDFKKFKFAKNFNRFAKNSYKKFDSCMPIVFNQLLDNLENARGGEVQKNKNPLSCTTNVRPKPN